MVHLGCDLAHVMDVTQEPISVLRSVSLPVWLREFTELMHIAPDGAVPFALKRLQDRLTECAQPLPLQLFA